MAKKKTKKAATIENVECLPMTSLEVANILRLRAFRVSMDPQGVVIIEGSNEQGKSSAIKSLAILLAGMSKTPQEPIHGDAKTGEIIGKFGHITVRKVFARGKPAKLTIESDEISYAQPQTLLNTFLKHISLDIGEFAAMDDRKRFDAIAKVLDLDIEAINAKRKRLYDDRRDANRDRDRLQTEYDAMPHHEDAPAVAIDVSEAMAQLEEARAHNRTGEKLDANLEAATERVQEATDAVEEAERRLEKARAELVQAKTAVAGAKQALVAFDPIDTAKLEATVTHASEINAKISDNARRTESRQKYMQADALATGLNDQLEELDRLKRKMTQAAQDRLPIPGLTLGDGEVLYNGKPLSQAGSSATALVSVALAMALNKDSAIKLLLIDDAEKFDPPTTRKVLEMAHERGFQVMMARVGDGEKATVVIEDGVVRPQLKGGA